MPSLIDYQPGDMLLLMSSPGRVESEVPHSPVYTVPVHFSPQLVPQHQTGPYKNLAAAQPLLSPFYGCYTFPDVTVTPQHIPSNSLAVRDVLPATKHAIDMKSADTVLPPMKK